MKLFLLIILNIAFFIPLKTEGQFLKKLKQRVENATEETAIMKAEEKTSEKTGDLIDKAFDNLFRGKKKNGNTTREDGKTYSDDMLENDSEVSEGGGMSKLQELMNSAKNMGSVDYSNLPKSYDFGWKYVMNIKIEDNEEIQMTYYLQPNADYMGMKMDMSKNKTDANMFMVVDNAREFGIMLMDVDKTKYASIVSTPTNNYDYDLYNEDLGTEFSFKEIGSKTILGYNCKGFRMEDVDNIVIMYMTTDAEVSFNKLFKADSNNAPSGFNPQWLKQAEKGVILEMGFINKSFNNKTTKMYCTELAKEPFTVKLSDYQIMKSNFMK